MSSALSPFVNEPALATALVALGIGGIVWIVWPRWRRLRNRRTVIPAMAAAHRPQTDAIFDLLLVCTDTDIAHLFERWLSTEVLPRTATTAEETVERLIDRRPDIVWLISTPDAAPMTALAQTLRDMQTDAYEAPSWIVALTSCVPARYTGGETEIFDQIVPEPRSQRACVDAFRQTIASMPRSHDGPWIQHATENAMPGFLASRQMLSQSIIQAMREGRNADAAKSAHTLAGSPGMHNFDKGVAACRYIEQHHATAEFTELLRRANEIHDLINQIELR